MTAIESIGDIVEQMKGLALSAKNDASATNPIKDVEEKPGKAGKSGGKWGKVGERFLEHGKIFENYLYRNEKMISRQTGNFRNIKDGRGFSTEARSS